MNVFFCLFVFCFVVLLSLLLFFALFCFVLFCFIFSMCVCVYMCVCDNICSVVDLVSDHHGLISVPSPRPSETSMQTADVRGRECLKAFYVSKSCGDRVNWGNINNI